MSIFKQFTTAVCGFHKYPLLLQQKGIKVFLYLILLLAVYSVIMLLPFYTMYHKSGGLVNIIQTAVPEFTIEDGILKCDASEGLDASGNIYYKINTDEQLNADDAGEYIFAVLADADSIITKNNGETTELSYAELGIENLSKADLLKYFSVRSSRLVPLMFFAACFAFVIYFVQIILLMWLVCFTALLNNLIFKTPLRFRHIIKLCIYCITFPCLFQAVMLFMGFSMPTFIYLGLIAVYIYLGLKNCKNFEDIQKMDHLPEDGIVIAEL